MGGREGWAVFSLGGHPPPPPLEKEFSLWDIKSIPPRLLQCPGQLYLYYRKMQILFPLTAVGMGIGWEYLTSEMNMDSWCIEIPLSEKKDTISII